MTLNEKYYAINTKINQYLKGKNISARVYKYGINPSLVKKDRVNTSEVKYPYFQSSIDNKHPQPFTSRENGILMNFDYQLNYYTGPHSEFQNDTKYFWPFEVVANAMGDIALGLIWGIANILHVNGPYYFEQKSGQSVPQAVLVYNMQAVCSYEADIEPASEATNIDPALQLELKNA